MPQGQQAGAAARVLACMSALVACIKPATHMAPGGFT